MNRKPRVCRAGYLITAGMDHAARVSTGNVTQGSLPDRGRHKERHLLAPEENLLASSGSEWRRSLIHVQRVTLKLATTAGFTDPSAIVALTEIVWVPLERREVS